jgi:hypothetical protein
VDDAYEYNLNELVPELAYEDELYTCGKPLYEAYVVVLIALQQIGSTLFEEDVVPLIASKFSEYGNEVIAAHAVWN